MYADTSALVKLVVQERESEALTRALPGLSFVSSEITVVELLRAVARVDERRLDQARQVLLAVDLVALHRPLLALAGGLPPPSLRSLDAVHLATAGQVGHRLEAFLSYDARLGAAAAAQGFRVLAPGAA